MGLNPAAIRSGQSGGLDLHRSFLAPGQQPPELKCLRTATASGKISAGTQHWLPTKDLPNDAWLSPGELLLPFRLYNMVEEQLKWFATQFPDTVLPRDLLRTHLTEVISPDMLDEQSSYLGNRLAACTVKQQPLFLSCCGSAGHKLALTVLRTDADACQCIQQLSVDTGQPVHQISISSNVPSDRSANDTDACHDPHHIFVAVRGHHQIAVYKTTQHQDGVWQLQLVAAVQSKDAVRDVAWSPFDPCQAAFICQGGSLHTLQVADHPAAAGRLHVQAHTVVQGGHAALSSSGSNSSSRMSCQWTHPAKLACTAGRNLVQCQLAGRGRPGRVVLLHSRPEGDPFLGLVISSQGPGAATSSFLAASTARHVLLFDTRHFNAPVLTWAHGMVSEPPQLLQFALSSSTPGDHKERRDESQQNRSSVPMASWQVTTQGGMAGKSPEGSSNHHVASQADANYPNSLPSLDPYLLGDPSQGVRGSQAWPATQASQASDPFLAENHASQSKGHGRHVAGAILAGGLALGECKAFRFVEKPSGQCLTALPPEELGRKKPNRGPIKFRKRENWGLIEVKSEQEQLEAGSFAWKPRIADAIQSWNLPRTVCQPLKRMSDVTKGPALVDLTSAHGEDAEEKILQYPDLQGLTLLPMENVAEEEGQSQQSSGPERPDALLARASFVGDLFLDPCFLFTPVSDNQRQPPQQIAVSLANAGAAEGQADRQAEGQADRQAEGQGAKAAGPVKPTARRQTGEAVLEAVGVAARHAPLSSSGQANQSRTQANLTNRQGQKAKAVSERQKLRELEGEPDPPEPVPPDHVIPEAGSKQTSGSMLRNLDIRQNISSRAGLKRLRHADPRWKTDRYQVMFEQKGLFQADVSIHHALCATALQNYHTSAKRLQSGGPCDPFGGPEVDDSALQAQLSYSELPSNEWGFGRMPERIAAAQETSSEGSEANAEGPVVRLPHLQGATTVDEVEARMRWETANADGKNAAFDSAIPGPKFKAPDKAAAVSRALPLVAAAYRSLRNEASSSSSAEQAASFLAFAAADLAPAVAAACQHAEHAMEDDQDDPDAAAGGKLEYGGDRMIPLASWTGTGLGPLTGATGQGPAMHRASEVALNMDSQASVHQASQGMTDAEDATTRVTFIPADRVIGAGQLACPVMPAQAWCGAPLLPLTQTPLLSLNNYCSVVGPGQEYNDIQELQDLWLSAHGRRRDQGNLYIHATGAGGVEHIPNDKQRAAATRRHQPSDGHMLDATFTGISDGNASHADHRSGSQPQQAVTSGPLGVYAERSIPAVTHSRMDARQGPHCRSVQFTTPPLSGRTDPSATGHREENAATLPPMQEPANVARGRLPTDQRDMAEQIGVASALGLSARKASSLKLQVKKKTKPKPSFVEGF